MKVWIVLKNQHDETLLVNVFNNIENAERRKEELQKKADQYTTYFVEEWEVQ